MCSHFTQRICSTGGTVSSQYLGAAGCAHCIDPGTSGMELAVRQSTKVPTGAYNIYGYTK